MPIYEYACPRCRKKFNFLVRNVNRPGKFACPRCGGTKLKRIYSSFSLAHSDNSRLEKIADPSFLSGLDEKDPRSLGRMMRRLAGAAGEEMDEETQELCRRMEEGEDPQKLEEEFSGGGAEDDRLYD
jgi:putative FmdB family regulatory protein